ncbi:MAG TPA: serine/threonine-protein kinase [Gemmatimonadales bacterium]
MPAHDRSRIEALFEAALERPAGERGAFLAACEDAVVRAEVSALLEAHGRTHGVFEAGPVWGALTGPAEGKRIGAYRLVRQLGRGGMGVVWLAERDDGHFQQQAAIKFLNPGPTTAELVERFVAERQILAALDHPNVARLLDGGVTGEGWPYYVMEYVDGEPLDAFAARTGLGLEERLRLFCEIAHAVHYAHRNLVVHRDLKPSNILVTAEGQPKLLDFGIAKLLDPQALPQGAPLTQTGLRLMTPDYASPEQVRGAPITTAADVYSLGVVLYELLAGRRPFDLSGRSLPQIEWVVCEIAPPALSSAAPPELRRRLRGDLDRIVALALRKEPERRYASAEQLAEDIERFLAGEPVQARADSAGYRAGKFVRRHRLPVALVTLLVLSLAGYGIVLQVQNRRTTAALVEARAGAEKAAELNDFLLTLFEPRGADPMIDSLVIGTMVSRAEERAARVKGSPAAATASLTALGRVYRHLGRYPEAVARLEQALARAREAYGEDHLQVADVQWVLADAYLMAGRSADAERELGSALRTLRAQLGPDHPRVAYVLSQMARQQRDRGDLALAEQSARDALAIRRGALRPDDPDVISSVMILASILRRRGALDEAEPLYREALESKRSAYEGDHADVAIASNNLGLLLADMGRYAEAERLLREALAMHTRVLGEGHPNVATGLTNLGEVLTKMGRLDEAEQTIRTALDRRRAALGDSHPNVAVDLHNLGVVLRQSNRPAEAVAAFREALDLRRRALGDDHPQTAESARELAALDGLTQRRTYHTAPQGH